jgi:hypothetical protein
MKEARMKTIRNMAILVGVGLALFASGTTSAKAQTLTSAAFSGTFTLPFDAQWGSMNLPAGDYNLYYGRWNGDGAFTVEIMGNADRNPHGVVLTRGRNLISTGENVLVCVRKGNKGYVRSLKLPAIGEAAEFAMPHGVEVESKLIAKHESSNPRMAEVRISVNQVPINLNAN